MAAIILTDISLIYIYKKGKLFVAVFQDPTVHAAGMHIPIFFTETQF
jgi:hypothetical protein